MGIAVAAIGLFVSYQISKSGTVGYEVITGINTIINI